MQPFNDYGAATEDETKDACTSCSLYTKREADELKLNRNQRISLSVGNRYLNNFPVSVIICYRFN